MTDTYGHDLEHEPLDAKENNKKVFITTPVLYLILICSLIIYSDLGDCVATDERFTLHSKTWKALR